MGYGTLAKFHKYLAELVNFILVHRVRENQTNAHYNLHPYYYMIVPTVIVKKRKTNNMSLLISTEFMGYRFIHLSGYTCEYS